MKKVKTLILAPFAVAVLMTGCDTQASITAFDRECSIDAQYRIKCDPPPRPPVLAS